MRFVLVVLSLCFALCLVACGSSSDGGGPTDASSGDANGGDAADAAPTDAGPDINQDPNTYPAMHSPIPQMDNHGGPLLSNVKLVTVTFEKGMDPDGGGYYRGSEQAFDDFIGGSLWWSKTIGGFGAGPGKGAGHADLDPALVMNKNLDDKDIAPFLQAHIASGEIPAPDSQTLYVLFYPYGTQIQLGNQSSCSNFAGYHSSADIAVEGGTTTIAYAVIPNCEYYMNKTSDFHVITITTSHEIAEAVTDPHVNSMPTFYLSTDDAWTPGDQVSTQGGECGDLCELLTDYYDESGYQVQRIWSNAAAKASQNPCQPARNPIYFGAAPRTTPQPVNAGGRHISDGYILVKQGASTDVILDVFSTAQLDHDFQLFVGRDPSNLIGQSGGDPTSLNPIGGGITAMLSKTQVHNGNGVIMTLTVPATAPRGDYKFLIRSYYDPANYNDWPVIAEVQ